MCFKIQCISLFCKIVRSSVILLLPLFKNKMQYICKISESLQDMAFDIMLSLTSTNIEIVHVYNEHWLCARFTWVYCWIEQGISTWLLKLRDRVIKEEELCRNFWKGENYHSLSVSCQLDLFDKVVKFIVLYGSEVRGFRNYYMVEKVHLTSCKVLLNLKTSTVNCLVYGEPERCSLSVDIK